MQTVEFSIAFSLVLQDLLLPVLPLLPLLLQFVAFAALALFGQMLLPNVQHIATFIVVAALAVHTPLLLFVHAAWLFLGSCALGRGTDGREQDKHL